MSHTSSRFLPDIQINASYLYKKHWTGWLLILAVFFVYHEAKGKWELIILWPLILTLLDIIRQFFIPFRVIAIECDDESGKIVVHYKPRLHPAIAMQISYEKLEAKVYQRKGWWTKKLKAQPTKIVLLSNKTEMIDLDEDKGFSNTLLAQILVKLSAISSRISVQ